MSMRYIDVRPAIVSALAPPPAATAPAPETPAKAVKVQFEQAIAFMQAGKDKEAGALFTHIVKLDPKLASPHTNLGILFYREGKQDKAEAAFKEALQLDGKEYVAANYLGMLYRFEGRFAAAESAYKQALAANPDYGYAHLNLAILYDLYLDDLPQALKHYQRYQQLGGESDKRLAGWLADLHQRMKSTSSEGPKP
jgi:Flp pilus assembly protein TadD